MLKLREWMEKGVPEYGLLSIAQVHEHEETARVLKAERDELAKRLESVRKTLLFGAISIRKRSMFLNKTGSGKMCGNAENGGVFLPQEHAQVAKIKAEFAQQLIEMQQQAAAAAHAAAVAVAAAAPPPRSPRRSPTPRARRTKSKASSSKKTPRSRR